MLIASLIASPASAQDTSRNADDEAERMELEEIVVTGSRLRRPGFDTLEAAIVTDAEQIERRGYTSVGQVLDDTPGFVPSGVNPVSTGQGTLNAGQHFADFFGLGSQRTLTLVNGRRFVSSNSIGGSGNTAAPGQQVDLNLIPAGLVERVETIAIGGAPIYGSDAIAGTVNVILKDDFEGFTGTAQYGLTEAGDGESLSARGLAGFNFAQGRGNLAVGAEFNKQAGMRLSERTGSRFALPNLLGEPAANLVTNDITFASMSEGGLPYNPATFGNIVDGSGTPLQFKDGGLVPFITGDPLNGLIAAGFADGGDGVRLADHNSLLTPTERYIATAIGHFDLTPAVRVFGELAYGHTEGAEISELAAFADPFQNGTAIVVSTDNPFISDSARATLAANGVSGPFLMARNLSDLLERDGSIREQETDMIRTVAGLEGDFTLFENPASWDLSFNFGRSRTRMDTTQLDNDRFLEALDAVDDGSGNVVCASGNPECAPLNLFGVNAFSDAAADYVSIHGNTVSDNEQYVATANLTGALPVEISTSPVGFNVGAEYRKEYGTFEPDAVLGSDFELFGFTYASAFRGDAGSYNTKELYGELSIPLVTDEQGLPFVKSLSAETAARYVDNSIAGGDVTWSAGGRFAPRLPGVGDGLMLRGMYAEAIRSPAITELFSGSSPTRGGITDPCGFTNFDQGTNPAVREANCRAALDAIGTTPETFEPTTAVLSAIGTISGNPELENETAESWSLGIVYQPEALPGFRLAADWSEIELSNGIESLGIETLIGACYDNPDFPNVPACDAFRRLDPSETGPGTANPTRVPGDIADGYTSGYFNVASLDFSGLILVAEYSMDVPSIVDQGTGALSFSAKSVRNSRYVFRTSASDVPVNDVGQPGLPDWSGQFNVGYGDERLELLLEALWTDAVQNDKTAGPELLEPQDNDVESYWRFNATVGYRLSESLRLQLVVNNLLDEEPTPAQLFSSNFGTYDLLGRRFLLRATMDL